MGVKNDLLVEQNNVFLEENLTFQTVLLKRFYS
jgi:hypothetical protein